MKKLLALVPILLLGLFLAVTLRPVADDEMCPSLCQGDWYLQLPGSPGPGDVVRIHDPMDRSRTTLRRVMALPGTRIGWEGNTPIVNGRAVRQRIMEQDEKRVVLLEGDDVLIQTFPREDKTRVTPEMLRKTDTWLAADNRDEGLDSRHWGKVPEEDLGWTVVLRFGPSNLWQRMIGAPGRSRPLPQPGEGY